MNTLSLKISRKAKKYHVELNADQFERLAATLGMFSREFLQSLARSEREIRQGKTKKLRSLKDLR